MSPSRTKSLLIKLFLIIISISLFGFHNLTTSADSDRALGGEDLEYGWVEVIIFGEGGDNEVKFTWHQAQATLPITAIDIGGVSRFQGDVFTFAQGNINRGPISGQAGWPVRWTIDGSVQPPPDCTIRMTIHETWYPGFSITCAPIVGCVADVWPAGYFVGVPFSIPWDRAWGTEVSSANAWGVPVHLTAVIYHVVTGGGSSDPSGIDPLGCEYHVMFPVIPQGE